MKLHLGCGAKFIPGWFHVDLADFKHVTLRHEVDSLPMLPDNSVEQIYTCHVFEHFMRREAQRVLREWHRVLAPAGILRLAVPDFEAVVEHYHEHRDLALVIGLVFGRQDGLYGFHHTVWDFAALERELIRAGFALVRRYDWRETEHHWLDDYSQSYLPHMDKVDGRLMSLHAEAVK